MEAGLRKPSRFMREPLLSARTLDHFAESLAALYALNATPDGRPAEFSAFPEALAEVEPLEELPRELAEVADFHHSRGLDRYLDLLLVRDGAVYRLVRRRTAAGSLPALLKVGSAQGRMLVPAANVLRAYMAEGERGLAAALAWAGVVAGFAAERLGAEVGGWAELGLPRTVLMPVHVRL